MDNPYKPGTVKYQILNGDWSGMCAAEIAEKIGCPIKTVNWALYELKKDGFNIKKVDRRYRPQPTNGNIYPPHSKIWKLYDGNWAEKTTIEIAQELELPRKTVRQYIYQIRKETGKYVDFLDCRKGRSGHKKIGNRTD